MASFFRGLWNSYNHLLSTRPLLTKSVTSAVITGAGDSIQQGIEHSQRVKRARLIASKAAAAADNDDTQVPMPSLQYDWMRTARFATFGLVVVGPLFHKWVGVLEKLLPGGSPSRVVGKVLLDQCLMAPRKCCVVS
jgi:hypothetical protein